MTFTKEVLKFFAFLVKEHRAEYQVISDHEVRYILGFTMIEIFQDPYSYEIDLQVKYSSKELSGYGKFNLFDILSTKEQKALNNSVHFQAYNDEVIKD